MSTKRIKCRVHGGYFTVEARRGRPPVKCTEDNECDAQKVPSTSARTGSSSLGKRMAEHASKTPTSDATRATVNASGSSDRANWSEARQATVREINRIFTELSKLGWTAQRSWADKSTAEITATRGEEMIYVTVVNGTATMQYSLWSFDKPAANKRPATNLPFDPDEIGDGELARYLVGSRVTWYNRLSGKEETAICGKESIRIEHGFNARGDEIPGERIIKFVDADEMSFRAFRLDQLLKVGK